MRIDQFVQAKQEAQDEAAVKALEKGETYTRRPVLDQSYIARGLSRILNIEQEKIEKKLENNADGNIHPDPSGFHSLN